MKPNDSNPYLESPLLTVAQAAKYLTLSKQQLYLMIQRGEIPYVKLSKRRKALHKKTLDEWLEAKIEKVH